MPRIVIGKYLGKSQSFIQKSGDDSSLDNIHNNIEDFIFHSDFSNLVELSTSEHTFTIPAFNSVQGAVVWGGKTSGTAVYIRKYVTKFLLAGVNVDANTYCVSTHAETGQLLEGGYILRTVNDATQFAAIEYVGNQAYLRIDTFIGSQSLPAMAITVKSQLFEVLASSNDGSGVIAEITPERVRFGEGAFDSDKNYLIAHSDGSNDAINIPSKPVLYMGTESITLNSIQQYAFSVSYNFNGLKRSSILTTYQPDQVPVHLGVL